MSCGREGEPEGAAAKFRFLGVLWDVLTRGLAMGRALDPLAECMTSAWPPRADPPLLLHALPPVLPPMEGCSMRSATARRSVMLWSSLCTSAALTNTAVAQALVSTHSNSRATDLCGSWVVGESRRMPSGWCWWMSKLRGD